MSKYKTYKSMKTKAKIKRFLSHPTKKNFNEIKVSGLYLQLIYQKLEDKSILLNFFGFEEWKHVYDTLSGDLEKLALKKLGGFENTFKEIFNNRKYRTRPRDQAST